MPKNRKVLSPLKPDFVQKLIDALANPGTKLNPLQLDALMAHPYSLLRRTLSDYVTAVAIGEIIKLEAAINRMIEEFEKELEKRPYYYFDEEKDIIEVGLKEVVTPQNVLFGREEKIAHLEKLIQSLEESIKNIDARRADFIKNIIENLLPKLKEKLLSELNRYKYDLHKEIEKLEKEILVESREISKEEELLRNAKIPIVDKLEKLTADQRQTVIPGAGGKTAEEVTQSRIERLEKVENYKNQIKSHYSEVNLTEKHIEAINQFDLNEKDLHAIVEDHEKIIMEHRIKAEEARRENNHELAQKIEDELPQNLHEYNAKFVKEKFGMDFKPGDEKMGKVLHFMNQANIGLRQLNNERKIHEDALQEAKAKQKLLHNALTFIQKTPPSKPTSPAPRNGH